MNGPIFSNFDALITRQMRISLDPSDAVRMEDYADTTAGAAGLLKYTVKEILALYDLSKILRG